MALTNTPVPGPDVHPLDKIDHDRLSVAEEGALETSEHLERVSERERKTAKPAAAAAATRRASTRKTAAKKTAKKTPSAKRGTAARRPQQAKKKNTSDKARPARRRPSNVPAGGEKPRDVAAELLRKAGGELPVGELAQKVVESGRTTIGGKTPHATIAAQIYVAAKNGVLFKKTSRGKVALLDPVAS